MKLFDTHCHLDDSIYDKDIEDVFKRLIHNGVEALTIVGIDQKSSTQAVLLSESRSGFYAAVGVHPHEAKNCSEETLQYLRGLSNHPKVCAWGEIGLDFNRMYSPRKEQEKWFKRQLDIADERNLPIILHERDSKGRLLEILNERYKGQRQGVVHCFSGNAKELDNYLNIGFFIGITGILTLKDRGTDLRKFVQTLPVDRIVIETDAPYLTPAPEKNRTKRNEPAFVKSVLLKLADVRKEDPEILSKIIWKNSCRLYNIEI
ncbi:MAG: TatD family hydrolase [Desulfobacterales bacterium]|nr:TatD family hydrolase [Desulfobacterales bacterium]